MSQSTDYTYDAQGQFFPYFVLTITALVTIPTTVSWLRPSKDLENTAPRIHSDYRPEHANIIASLKAKQKRRERKIKRAIVSIGGWLIIASMVYLIIVTARTITKIWDPYDVLGISRSATEKQIKSFYRRLSLTEHPDKRRPDPARNETVETINEHWVELTKAFKALTDEEVRRNYLEFGHPDGKQSFSIGIALPMFIITDGNGKYVLLFYISLLAVVLPYYVGKWWYGSQKTTKEGILVNSAGTLFQAFKEDLDAAGIITAVSGGEEFNELLIGEKAESGLSKIEQRVLAPGDLTPLAAGLSVKVRQQLQDMDEGPRRKALALIWAHLGNIELDNEELNTEKFESAVIAHKLNEAFTVIALHFGATTPVLASYNLSQCLIQAIPPGSSPLLQLPHFTPKVVEAIEGKGARKHWSIQQFMALPASIRRSKVVGAGHMTGEQYQKAAVIAQQLPYLKVEKTFFKVHGEKFVTPNSLVQFVVKARVIPPGSVNAPAITDNDLGDVEKLDARGNAIDDENRVAPPLAHSPFFARDHSPRWHIFLADSKQGKIAVPPFTFSTFDKPLFNEDGTPTYNVQTLKMQFGAPPQAGRYTFQMNLVCDSYVGLDTQMHVTMEVEEASKAEAMVDDGEISEPDEDSIAGQMAQLRGGAVKKAQDSDDESDGSNTDGEDAGDDDTSETDTDTDEE
ncbi:hypothetical protein FKW77_000226 [Venturia effusa]|uniref:J domain-containing protein n=1 Tax=Venturia effusa TaxID=50376 RepID=A0A517LPH4_9PEZI|nr:hypothetical protein FKW77_000226 [Venturia effusa]